MIHNTYSITYSVSDYSGTEQFTDKKKTINKIENKEQNPECRWVLWFTSAPSQTEALHTLKLHISNHGRTSIICLENLTNMIPIIRLYAIP